MQQRIFSSNNNTNYIFLQLLFFSFLNIRAKERGRWEIDKKQWRILTKKKKKKKKKGKEKKEKFVLRVGSKKQSK